MKQVRMAKLEDAKEINAIYENYILNTAVTFEYDPVSDEAFMERMRKIQSKLPYLVCEIDGVIAGYAYLAPFKSRAAFGWDVETTVYVKEGYYRRSIATALYSALIQFAKELGYVNIYALITEPNEPSKKMHEAYGFAIVGHYPETGYKLEQWWGLNVMCKRITKCQIPPRPIQLIHELSITQTEEILKRASEKVK